jgi:hypothetical protein
LRVVFEAAEDSAGRLTERLRALAPLLAAFRGGRREVFALRPDFE